MVLGEIRRLAAAGSGKGAKIFTGRRIFFLLPIGVSTLK